MAVMGTTVKTAVSLDDLRAHLSLRGIPHNSRCETDYTAGKIAMLQWRVEHLDQPSPSFESCVRAVADYVGV